MLQAMRYIPKSGNLEIKIDGHRHVLESAKSLSDGGIVVESDDSNEDSFVKSVFTAIKGEIPDSSVNRCDYLPGRGVIRVDDRIITPDDDLTGEESEVQTFAGAVFTTENIAVYEAGKPVEYEKESEDFEDFKIENGKHIRFINTREKIKTRSEPLFNEDGSRSMRDGKPRFVEVPVTKNQ